MWDAPNPQQTAFTQLTSAMSIMGLLSRKQNDARLHNLIDNLWLDRRRLRPPMTPEGLATGTSGGMMSCGDRWANEIPAIFCSHLTGHAVWPRDEMCELLEQNVDMFREEFAGIDPSQYQVDARDHAAGLTDGRNWTVFPFYDGHGNLEADNARKCPRIAEFLSSRAGVGRMSCMAFFSIMDPQTHVPAHTSPLNVRMRYHLGIEVPEGDCYLRIHDQKVAWEQGRCIKIDDSYEHEVFQQSDRRRVVLVVDVPHPELRHEEIEFLQEFLRYTNGVALPPAP
jgi:Aspartyl/Asparaginyl beta-hydroxylase